MSPAVAELQKLLLSAQPNYNTCYSALGEAQQALTGVELARARPLRRLVMALQYFAERGAAAADIAVLLRQIIRSNSTRLWISAKLWRSLAGQREQSGLRIVDETAGTVQLTADDWLPVWLPAPAAIDVLALRRFDMPTIGDSLLIEMADFDSYQSAAQKAAVTACFFAPPGSTTLVTLPTGAGKSLCSLLPAWSDSGGGRMAGGTTLVVVPTVSLALDQAEQALKRFGAAQNDKSQPHALISSTPPQERAVIRAGLSEGTLPILYTSPEAIMHSELYNICLEAAAAGKLTRLVIDEAHLVQSWGAGFRTDFQFLATYRKKLLAQSQGALRTILLSATVGRECDDLLEALFSEPGHFNCVRGNRLRPEPSYWFDWAATPEIRRSRVIEALHNLPRPAILYVTRPVNALEWRRILRHEQFRRIDVFSGKTQSQDRERLVRAWNADEIDLMIATSAFGLGVDKPDVRTIIHGCLPESTDRFYQEVGRAGRDGCSAISLLCAAPGDEDLARGMTRSSLIKPPNALDRWYGMHQGAYYTAGRGDLFAVDTNAAPHSKPDMPRSELNQEWNEHTLLLMQRAGLIEILTTRDESGEKKQTGDAAEVAGAESERLQISLLSPAVVSQTDLLETAITAARAAERQEMTNRTRRLLKMVQSYSGSGARQCLADEFARTYPGTALACGGCSCCRRAGIQPYAQPIPTAISIESPLTNPSTIKPDLLRLAGGYHILNLYWEGHRSIARVKELRNVAAQLILAGLRQIIIPAAVLRDQAWAVTLIKHLAQAQPVPRYVLLSDEQLDGDQDLPLVSTPTLVVYPHTDDEADLFYLRLRPHLTRRLGGQFVVNIVHYALRLDAEQGLFLDRVNGFRRRLADLPPAIQDGDDLLLP